MKLTIRTKLVLVVSLIIVLLSSILTIISCTSNYSSSAALLQDFIPKVVNSTSLAVGNRIGDYVVAVQAHAKSAQLANPSASQADITAALGKMMDPNFHYLGFVNQAGQYTTTNGEKPADETFLQESLAGADFFSEPFKDNEDNTLLGLASSPVLDAAGKATGVLFGVFDYADLCDIVKNTSVSENTSPAVYNPEGKLMVYSDVSLVIDGYNLYGDWLDGLKSDKGIREAYARALGGQQAIEYLNVDGERIIFAYAPVPHTNWSYNFYVPESDFLDEFYRSIIVNIVAALVLLALSIFAIARYGTRLVRPIKMMRDRIVALSQGDLRAVTDIVYSHDEVEDLARALEATIMFLNNCIEDITAKLKDIGNCNLRVNFDMDYQGDFAEIPRSFQMIVQQLDDTFQGINKAAGNVSSRSGQVSSNAQALSQGATQQASATQELAATISEISERVRSNAQDAGEASGKVGEVSQEMMRSNQKMKDMTSAMDEISQSSNKIGKIIKAIEDIAFQTNILALNAAVEAARAGAAGKGFAVVADEVRNLANKSQEASKNTSALIESSLRSVENGTRVAHETAQSLIAAVDGAKEVTVTVDRISQASAQQADAIVQVTQGVDQIAAVVQNNSATAQESAAVSEELAGQAQILKRLVGRFQLSADGRAAENAAVESGEGFASDWAPDEKY